jgi:hypothetical protein
MIFFRKHRMRKLMIRLAQLDERISMYESPKVKMDGDLYMHLSNLRVERAGIEEELAQLGHVNEALTLINRIKEKA